jgi:hypothetical protein
MEGAWPFWRKMTLFCKGLEGGAKFMLRLAYVWGYLAWSLESRDDNGCI